MNSPWGIALDNMERLHVTNYHSNAVNVFESNGNIVREYGHGDVNQPTGISVTADNFSIVANCGQTNNPTRYNLHYSSPDNYTSKVVVYNENFARLYTCQDILRGYGVTCDREGCIFVCDSGNSRIIKY